MRLAAAAPAFPMLAALAPPELAELEARAQMRSLRAGTVYLREGDTCAGIALVIAGRIRVARTSDSGREITLYHIGPGETCILTASCLLSNARYPAQATVVEDVTALLVPTDVFRHLMATSEPLRAFIFGQFGSRLDTVMALVEEVAFARVDRRLASWLAAEAGRLDAPLSLSHEEIASHVGTARVVVSRVLETFEDKGWVTLGRRRVDIRDPAALARYGNQSD
ncbi:MAG TPA: Crp/Fnr family transcriptional regulator [Gemmatimonadaceae bacterium]|nr:Crp/Fnr family transcriptional regulator [Gemmatimonadaceae bacterium]